MMYTIRNKLVYHFELEEVGFVSKMFHVTYKMVLKNQNGKRENPKCLNTMKTNERGKYDV